METGLFNVLKPPSRYSWSLTCVYFEERGIDLRQKIVDVFSRQRSRGRLEPD